MLMPGIGEQLITTRARLSFAFLLTLVLFPPTRTILPAVGQPTAAIGLLIGEIAVGLLIGLAIRMVVGALQTAGTVVAQQLGLSFAMTVDLAMGGQQASLGNLLTPPGITLIFAADLHHLAIAGIRDLLFHAAARRGAVDRRRGDTRHPGRRAVLPWRFRSPRRSSPLRSCSISDWASCRG